MKTTIISLAALAAILFTPLASAGGWSNSTEKDEMSGAIKAYAFSQKFSATKRMGFPYSDTKSWLGYGCDSESEWTYVGFTNSPNIINGENHSGYSQFTTRIKWDSDNPQGKTFTQDWGGNFIHFHGDDTAIIDRMEKHSSVLLELRWHGEGSVYFRYSLSGSSAAIKKARDACGFKPFDYCEQFPDSGRCVADDTQQDNEVYCSKFPESQLCQ